MRQAAEDLECTPHSSLLQSMEKVNRVVEQRINIAHENGGRRELPQHGIGQQRWRQERIVLHAADAVRSVPAGDRATI